ncbi:MAG TPA: GNAT family N-acetyltransferase [Acidimicrobiales bacterium]|nr:GNAT family N-acetyltransferase [Acidimicrobiales bacterium]
MDLDAASSASREQVVLGHGEPPRPATPRVVDPAAREVGEMVDRMLDDLAVLYSGFDRSVMILDPGEFRPPVGAWVVVELGGRPLASGGVRRCEVGDTIGELKRIWVEPEARGRGVARVLLAALERRAAELGYDEIYLDTGPRQHAAMRLYETSGYEVISNYGRNAASTFLTSYAKRLRPPATPRIASRSAW